MNSILKILPLFTAALLSLTSFSCISSKTGNTEITEKIIEPGTQEEPELTISAEEASKAYYSGELETSITMFKRIIKNNPDNKKALLSLIRLYSEEGRYNDIIQLYSSESEDSSFNKDKAESSASPVSVNEKSTDSFPDFMPEGALWEDRNLPVFLSGDYEKYLSSSEYIRGLENSEDFSKPDNSQKSCGGFLESDYLTPEIINDINAENLFFTALAYKDSGETEKAVNALERALNKRGFFPAADLLLGQLYFEDNEYALAAKSINTALKNDSNQTAGRVTLAKTILAGGKLSEGHAALKRAVSIRPWDRDTRQFLNTFEKNNPDIITTKKAVEHKRRLAAEVPKASVFTPEAELMPQIRVGLAENLKELYIKPGGDFQLTDAGGSVLYNGTKDIVIKITSSYGAVYLMTDDNKEILKHQGTAVFKCSSPSDTILIFNVVHSTGYLSAGKEDRAYRGKISLKPSGSRITVINTLPLEEYLYSVVPSEIPSYWPEEALCAQAVAARSYTLANMGKYRKKGYDVTGSIKSHFYRGLTGEHENTTAAVEKTRGMVLKAEGRYLNAFYSANSAGRTESAESVWGGKYPLYGVDDPHFSFENNPPSPYELTRWILSEPESYSSNPKFYYRSSYRWRLLVAADEIEARTGYSVGDIKSITTRGRGKSGRVEKILIKGTKGEKVIRGDKIRKSLGGLRSSLFIMMPKLDKEGMPEYFIFAGAGWGHGVGMCQTGSAGMAHDGFEYQQILKHYYPAAELEAMY